MRRRRCFDLLPRWLRLGPRKAHCLKGILVTILAGAAWTDIFVTLCLTHSRRRSDLKYLDLQVSPGFSDIFLSDGDSVYLRGNLFKNLGTPEETCLICKRTQVKTCCKFWQSYLF